MKNYVKCNDERQKDCFARTQLREGGCKVLKNTKFGDRMCPFFKTDAEYAEGIKQWGDGTEYILAHSSKDNIEIDTDDEEDE